MTAEWPRAVTAMTRSLGAVTPLPTNDWQETERFFVQPDPLEPETEVSVERTWDGMRVKLIVSSEELDARDCNDATLEMDLDAGVKVAFSILDAWDSGLRGSAIPNEVVKARTLLRRWLRETEDDTA